MTGGFTSQIRGIRIDVTKTLNKYYNQNQISYTREEFEEFLRHVGFHESYTEFDPFKPINTGFVVSLEYEDDDEPFAVLSTGIWEYQNWVVQYWSKSHLSKISDFYNTKHLNKNIENNLRNLWNKLFILNGDFVVITAPCEWSHNFSI